MALTVGTRLGHYDVTSLLGEGGMGQVWQATDTQLNRQVALKILPGAFAEDPDRLARFTREAQILASLNHPNIAAIHGIEEAEGTRALVLELVEGPTLADRIAKGPIPLDEALPIAKQIAEALEAAHEAGVIHRDLKPANIKVREDGTVKVLDFGLAKAFQPEAGSDPSESPTLTAAATRAGVILGTAAYMSPEQAKGKTADRRSDIWAFGCVLYEMLTGTRPFGGGNVSEVLAEVLKSEPNWEALPDATPATLRQVVRRCLQKDPKQRLHDVADLRLAMAGAFETATAPANQPGRWRLAAMIGIAVLVVGSLTTSLIVRNAMRTDPPQVFRFLITPPAEAPLTTAPPGSALAISRDGSHLAYIVAGGGGSRLAVRRIDQVEHRVFTDLHVASPFFSPDGASVAVFQRSVGLRRVGLADGVVRTITELPVGSGRPTGASWGDDGTIVFAVIGSDETEGLYRVPAAGGEATRILAPDGEAGEQFLAAPFFLPAGRGLLFTTGGTGINRVEWLQPDTGERRVLVDGGRSGRYAPTGHLVYENDGVLYAVAFDLDRLEVMGEPVPVVDSVLADPFVNVTLSNNGTLAYLSGDRSGAERGLVWVDRTGAASAVTRDRDSWVSPRVAPDGRRVAVTAGPEVSQDIWVLDTERGTRFRLTVDEGRDRMPVWSPDSTRVLFQSDRGGNGAFYVKRADVPGEAEVLLDDWLGRPTDWSPDGETMLISDGLRNIFTLPADGQGQPTEWLATPFFEHGAMFSPDGRWIVYASNESGRDQIYASAYPGPGERYIISTTGGAEPIWSPAGNEIFYRDGDRMMAVAVETEPAFVSRRPEVLFEGRQYQRKPANSVSRNYDVTPDGQRFLMIERQQTVERIPIHFTLNWFEELKRLVPVP